MAEHDADVVIVGAGALGAHVAQECAKAGKSVILLEAGKKTPNWKLTENWRSAAEKNNFNVMFGNLDYAPNSYTPGYIEADVPISNYPATLRTVGGTARHWTAIAWRFLPEEMKMRSTFGVGRDWPIDYDELEPFYTEAEYLIGVNGVTDADQSGQQRGHTYPPRSKPYPLPPEAKPYFLQRFEMRAAERGYDVQCGPNARISQPYAGRPACIGNNLCSWNCPIDAKYSGARGVELAVAAGAELRPDAIVDRIETDGSGKVTAVSYLDPTGATRTTLTAKAYVLAAHGFETPKLLLMNEIGNSSGMVGRNLMMHPTMPTEFYADEPLFRGRGSNIHGAILQRRLEDTRGEMSAGFWQFVNMNPAIEVASGLMTDGGPLGQALDDRIRDRASRVMGINQLTEDLPETTNGIELKGNWKDSLGAPGLKLHYKLGDYVKAALPRAYSDFANFMQAMNGTFSYGPTPDKMFFQHHIMGTVMMGDDPSNSVVDRNLRCHDHDNLYCVTTGVWPSASCVNPTLTGIAMAIRAGRHIAAEV